MSCWKCTISMIAHTIKLVVTKTWYKCWKKIRCRTYWYFQAYSWCGWKPSIASCSTKHISRSACTPSLPVPIDQSALTQPNNNTHPSLHNYVPWENELVGVDDEDVYLDANKTKGGVVNGKNADDDSITIEYHKVHSMACAPMIIVLAGRGTLQTLSLCWLPAIYLFTMVNGSPFPRQKKRYCR
jgi:hypothetical protein